MFNLQNCHWGQISLVLKKPKGTLEYSNTNTMKTQMMCDDMIWYGVEDVSIYQASDRSQSWACVTWQAGPGCPGCHWPSPDNNAAAVPCPLSGDNWWVLLLCHLGQETLHTGTSPWPLHSTFKQDLNCVPVQLHGEVMRLSWGFSAYLVLTFYHLFWQNISHFPWKVPLSIALSVSTCHKPANTDPPNTSFLLWNNVPTIYTTSSQHIQT